VAAKPPEGHILRQAVQDAAPVGSDSPKVEGRVYVALLFGLLSLSGLVFPPAIGFGIAAIALSVITRRRMTASGGRLRGRWLAWMALGFGVAGSLLSLVIPGFVVYIWIYAIFHGGHFPPGMEG
jgi:hypothetical protein